MQKIQIEFFTKAFDAKLTIFKPIWWFVELPYWFVVSYVMQKIILREARFNLREAALNWTWKKLKTRLHSSRMRTARLLPVFPSVHYAEGVPASGPGGSAPREGSALGDAWSWRGISAPRRGVCYPGGVCSQGVSQHAMGQTPLCTEFLTRATENITLPQTSLRVVKYLGKLARWDLRDDCEGDSSLLHILICSVIYWSCSSPVTE